MDRWWSEYCMNQSERLVSCCVPTDWISVGGMTSHLYLQPFPVDIFRCPRQDSPSLYSQEPHTNPHRWSQKQWFCVLRNGIRGDDGADWRPRVGQQDRWRAHEGFWTEKGAAPARLLLWNPQQINLKNFHFISCSLLFHKNKDIISKQ